MFIVDFLCLSIYLVLVILMIYWMCWHPLLIKIIIHLLNTLRAALRFDAYRSRFFGFQVCCFFGMKCWCWSNSLWRPTNDDDDDSCVHAHVYLCLSLRYLVYLKIQLNCVVFVGSLDGVFVVFAVVIFFPSLFKWSHPNTCSSLFSFFEETANAIWKNCG